MFIIKKNSISETANKVGCSKSIVKKWIQRYREHGLHGLFDLRRSGRPMKISDKYIPSFIKRIQFGSKIEDEVSVFKGKYIQTILETEFEASYSQSGVYSLLYKFGFAKVKPRPRHEKNNIEQMKEWKEKTLPKAIKNAKRKFPTKKIEVWFQDETRYGNKTKIASKWQLSGTSWNVTKQIGYKNCYIYGAVNPISGDHIGFVFPECNSEGMNIHLDLISKSLQRDSHVILIVDQAGWHSKSNKLCIPKNITLLDLPPYSPELNPMENLWLWIKENYLSNKFIGKKESLVNLGCELWKKVTNELVKSVCRVKYLSFANFL